MRKYLTPQSRPRQHQTNQQTGDVNQYKSAMPPKESGGIKIPTLNPRTKNGELANSLPGHASPVQKKENPIQRRALTKAETKAAKSAGRARFNSMSVRIIQNIVGLVGDDIDGRFGTQTVQAISDWQTANGLTDNGIIDVPALDQLMAQRIGNQTERHQAIRLVADYHNINLGGDTLTVFASNNAATNTRFEAGLRVTEIGSAFFANSAGLQAELNTQLAVNDPAPIMGPIPAAPNTLTKKKQRKRAISYNKKKLKDERSIKAIQHFMGTIPTGIIDDDFVQRVANVQNTTAALADVDGKIGLETLNHFFVNIRNAGNHNAVIQLLMDYYKLGDFNNLTTIYFEAVGASNATTTRNAHGPVRVEVMQGLYQSIQGAVHTIAHELEHVRQHREGILSSDTREFLGEALEVISKGLAHEQLFDTRRDVTNAAGTRFRPTDGLLNDAQRLLVRWRLMPLADQKKYWGRFKKARKIIRKRVAGTFSATRTQDRADWAAATPADRLTWTNLVASYNAEVKPR